MSKALADIAEERRRQVEEEEWTADHDDEEHGNGGLAAAAACYAYLASIEEDDAKAHKAAVAEHPHGMLSIVRVMWPWLYHWLKVGPKRRMLVKAGALIVAEIERLDRETERDAAETHRIATAS